MRCLRLGLAVVVVGLVTGALHRAGAQDVERAGDPDGGGSLSTELRFRLFTTAYRWSSYRSEAANLPDTGKRSLYLVPALGARFYPKHGHGMLVDVDYRTDIDLDSNAGFLCIFDCPTTLTTQFAVAHAGYAYRYVIPSHKQGRLTWTVTPHASVAAGASFSYVSSPFRQSSRSPVVGARFGLDIDLHIRRFFMGWTLRYEILRHTKGALRLSHFLSWNVVPVFAIGAVIGRKVQARGADGPPGSTREDVSLACKRAGVAHARDPSCHARTTSKRYRRRGSSSSSRG